MNNLSTYTTIEKARDGSPIPVAAQTALHSRYNPIREASSFLQQFAGSSESKSEPDFFIILGLAGGYHIASLLAQFPQATIVVVEASDEAIAFLSAIPCVQNLQNDRRVHITTPEQITQTLTETFWPAEHTKLQTASLRAWETVFPEQAAKTRDEIKRALEIISADFSVQSHFGGLWQRNIFENLAFYATARQKKQYAATFTAPHGKTAAIIAAGPSLDKAIVTLQKERANYYIIATDTAYPALMAQNIRADACISVDAQMISHAHFFSASPETLFIFDLSANPAAVRFAVKKGAPIMYAETGHPLSCLAAVSTQGACFPHIETGSGTVTSAAAAFAVQAGFDTLAFFGNDFAYLNGKPYTKGCYLDALYNTKSIHTMSAEQQFSALMFRTELIPTEHGVTTPILNAYRTANELFLHNHGYKAVGDHIYRCTHTQTGISCVPFDYRTFCKNVRDCLENDTRILLPYIAWLRQKQPKSTYKEILSLAQSRTLVYTYEDEN